MYAAWFMRFKIQWKYLSNKRWRWHTINEIQISDNSVVCHLYIDVGECFDSSSIVWMLIVSHTIKIEYANYCHQFFGIEFNLSYFFYYLIVCLCVQSILNLFTCLCNRYNIFCRNAKKKKKRIRSISFINWMYFTLFYHSKSASLNLQHTIYRWLQLNEVKQNLLKYIEVQNIWIWLVYRMKEYCANRMKNDMMKSTSEFDFITHY